MNKITSEQIKNLFTLPLNELIFKAREIHKKNFEDGDVQLASLISIKTGSCPEDCKYCPQSAHYNVNLKKENLIDVSEVKEAAKLAKKNGANRFCMGAAWKKLRDGKDIDAVIEMIKEAEASEIHMRISSPPIKFPDYYGIDTPRKDELIASSLSIENMVKKVKLLRLISQL